MNEVKIGIVGYGNIGRGVEHAVAKNPDMKLIGVFTRRDPNTVQTISGVNTYKIEDILDFKDIIDILILCGGSATDLPEQGPALAKHFSTIDSFDTHAKIPEYFEAMNKSASANGNISIISVGWDPGLFSIIRAYSEPILPDGSSYTFWGKGVSQGHSDAIRRIAGVKNAIQYTVPIDSAVDAVRTCTNPNLTTRQKHLRECFVVADDSADKDEIKRSICEMPNYFSDYDTIVNFISEDELLKNHSKMPHGGFVIRSGHTSDDVNQLMEFSLKLDSNPEFTASILIAYARAAYKLKVQGAAGALSVLDVAPALLSIKTPVELRQELL